MAEINIEGIDKIVAKLDSITDKQAVMQTMGQCCAIVERSAKQKARRDSGALRRSIQSRVEDSADGIQGVVYTNLDYAPYHEYGTGLFAEEGGRKDVPWHYQDDEGNWHTTSGITPQPFMRPALYENRDTILRKLKEGITK